MKLKNDDFDYKVSTAFAMSGHTIDKNTISELKIYALENIYYLKIINSRRLFFKWSPWKNYKETNFN